MSFSEFSKPLKSDKFGCIWFTSWAETRKERLCQVCILRAFKSQQNNSKLRLTNGAVRVGQCSVCSAHKSTSNRTAITKRAMIRGRVLVSQTLNSPCAFCKTVSETTRRTYGSFIEPTCPGSCWSLGKVEAYLLVKKFTCKILRNMAKAAILLI